MVDLTSKTERTMILGEIIEAWTEIEQALFGIFSMFLRRGHAEARAIFLSVRGFKEQREMTEALARGALGELSSRGVVKLLKEADAASMIRNKIIHGVWYKIGRPNGATGE